jgi:hypothetical protein
VPVPVPVLARSGRIIRVRADALFCWLVRCS